MVLRFALISLVLATWLMMPQSTEQSEQPDQTAMAATKPSAVIEPTKQQTSEASIDEKRAAKRKRRRDKKKRKEKRRKFKKDKRRRQKRRRKAKNNLKRRKDKLRKKARKLRRKKMRSRKNRNKKKSKKFKKRLKKLKKKKNKSRRRKEKRGERRRGVRRIRRGRKKKKQFCRTDSECKPGQCCKGNICADPGKGLKCFGPCMCQGREKTKNFMCVTKKRVMKKYLKKYGNDTNRPLRGRCRNVTLTELEDPKSKFVVVEAPKLENPLKKPRQ